jgi:hypothetical protein
VAIIHYTQTPPPNPGWIAVAADDPADNEVVQHGFAEATLRCAPLMVLGAWQSYIDQARHDWLGHRLDVWRDRYPDVPVQPVTALHGVAAFVASIEQPIQLTVIGRTDAGQILRLADPVGPSIFDDAECSVLVVRD